MFLNGTMRLNGGQESEGHDESKGFCADVDMRRYRNSDFCRRAYRTHSVVSIMKRRGVLGLLGGAFAAGPAMAKQAIASVETMTLPQLPYDLLPIEAQYGQTNAVSDAYNHGEWIRERIAQITGMTAEDRKDRIAQMGVNQLDPDLAVNRSMALWAKIAEQKRRNFEISIAREHRSLTRDLAEYLKREILQ